MLDVTPGKGSRIKHNPDRRLVNKPSASYRPVDSDHICQIPNKQITC